MTNKLKMNKNCNLLIVCQKQFGYHVDTLMYCKYLKRYQISYLCYDSGLPKQEIKNVKVKYVPLHKNLVLRNFSYFGTIFRFLSQNQVDICFIKYFRGCSFLKLFFPRKKFILDIRTGSIHRSSFFRFVYNFGLRMESVFFKNITAISSSLAEKLNLQKRAMILPLGSECISDKIKKNDFARLIYVGTLSNRHIEKTIHGVDLFVRNNPDLKPRIIYTIIGDGYHGEVEKLRALVIRLGLHEHVQVVGRIPFDRLKKFFDNHNIGVSFIPLTPYYDVQPPTKTFDYLLSGMPVIATATSENKKVINNKNGVLIDDTAESFAIGLQELLEIWCKFSSRDIMDDAQQYHWKYIVENFNNCLDEVVRR